MTTSRPLRIFHVFRAAVGGVFRHVTDLAAEQARLGHQVGMVCDSTTGGAYEDAILAELRSQLALGLHRVPMRRQVSPSDLTALWHVLAHMQAHDIDVVHGHGAKGGAYARPIGTWLRRRRPVARVYTPHGGSLNYDPATPRGWFYFTAERVLERLTDAIVHVSQFEAEVYRAKVHAPRCVARVILNGLREQEFEPVTPRPRARSLLFLGSFRKVKGVDVLLHAAAKLVAAGRDMTINLVGQEDGRQTYIDLAGELGLADRAAFLDPMTAREAFASAHLIVVPSFTESMPYVVLEAIAAQMPIVATDVGGIPEIFGPYTNQLVPPADTDKLANAIDAALADPQRARDDAGLRRAWMKPRFNLQAMEQQTTALYREILAQQAR